MFLSLRILSNLRLPCKTDCALNLYWIYSFYHPEFLRTCACPEKQSVPWIHCIKYIFFVIQNLDNLRLPWKIEFALYFSLYWIYFYHSKYLSNLRLPWKFQAGGAAAPSGLVRHCLCESGFGTLLSIKTKSINRLNSQACMRVFISNIVPRFEKLINKKQEQKSYWTEILYISERLEVSLFILIFMADGMEREYQYGIWNYWSMERNGNNFPYFHTPFIFARFHVAFMFAKSSS